jgi:NADPH-dependent curcumin reductase CurA
MASTSTENVGGAVWQAVLPLLNKFARVPVSGLVAQYNSAGPGDGPDRLPPTMLTPPPGEQEVQEGIYEEPTMRRLTMNGLLEPDGLDLYR